MSISLTKQSRLRAVESLRAYFAEHMDDEVGDLKAGLLLDFLVAEVGPTIYNGAIADAQAHLLSKVTDLGTDIYEPEFTYWQR